MIRKDYTLGIDIGSTTVKIAVLNPYHELTPTSAAHSRIWCRRRRVRSETSLFTL